MQETSQALASRGATPEGRAACPPSSASELLSLPIALPLLSCKEVLEVSASKPR